MKTDKPLLAESLASALRFFRWVALALIVLFALSGITLVQPGEVALVLRFGKLVGTTEAEQIHRPGLLFAWPYPIDRVIRVPVKKEGEVAVSEVWRPLSDPTGSDRIDPLAEGYLLTADQNLVQCRLVVKYRIKDPVAFALRCDRPETILHDVVLESLTNTLAGWRVDDVLRLQRPVENGAVRDQESLIPAVIAVAQARLDRLQCGLDVAALDIKEIHPPRHVVPEFQKAQSARIERETMCREAEALAAKEIPKAEAERLRIVQETRAYENALLARATAETAHFSQLYTEYKGNAALVRERLYRETVEQALQNAGKRLFVPPNARPGDLRLWLADTEKSP